MLIIVNCGDESGDHDFPEPALILRQCTIVIARYRQNFNKNSGPQVTEAFSHNIKESDRRFVFVRLSGECDIPRNSNYDKSYCRIDRIDRRDEGIDPISYGICVFTKVDVAQMYDGKTH